MSLIEVIRSNICHSTAIIHLKFFREVSRANRQITCGIQIEYVLLLHIFSEPIPLEPQTIFEMTL